MTPLLSRTHPAQVLIYSDTAIPFLAGLVAAALATDKARLLVALDTPDNVRMLERHEVAKLERGRVTLLAAAYPA